MPESNNLLRFATNLSERKTELDKNYFEQFIQPAWEAFEKIYSECVLTIKECIEFLGSDEFRYEKLMERIGRESVLAQDLRWDLVRLMSQVTFSESYAKTDLFNSVVFFLFSIVEYLSDQGIVAALFQINWEINGEINNEQSAKVFLDERLVEIRSQYHEVASKYQRLKASF